MSTRFLTLEGCQKNASERRTIYAAGEIMLFKSTFVPTPDNVTAEFEAAEADYSGYARLVVTSWLAPGLAPGTGWLISSSLVQFLYVSASPEVPNNIGGAAFVDAAGVVRLVVIFDEEVPMQVAGNIVQINIVDLFPTGY